MLSPSVWRSSLPDTMTPTTRIIWTSMRSCVVLTNSRTGYGSCMQLHNFCEKEEFGIIGIGMNSMGAHYNPVSLSIVNSESKDAIASCWDATVKGFYSLYTSVQICDEPECGFCTQIKENTQGPTRSVLPLCRRTSTQSSSAHPPDARMKSNLATERYSIPQAGMHCFHSTR